MVASKVAPRDLHGLAADLAWLDGLLAKAVAQQRARAGDEFRGIYISEAEVDELLDLPPLSAFQSHGSVARNGAAPSEAEAESPLTRLARRLGLSEFERQTVLLALGPQLDRRYGRLYAYLQDDLTMPCATPGLALELLCDDFAARAAQRAKFSPDAPLRALGLVELAGDEAQRLVSRQLTLDERNVLHLLGLSRASSAPPGAGRRTRSLILPREREEALGDLSAAWTEDPARPVLCITGEAGSGRRLAAEHLAPDRGLTVVTSPTFDADSMREGVREAALTGSVLCLTNADSLFDGSLEQDACLGVLRRALRAPGFGLVLTLSSPSRAPTSLGLRPVRIFQMPPLTTAARREIWLQEAALAGLTLGGDQAGLLAATYRLSGAQMRESVARTFLADGGASHPFDRLVEAARSLSTATLGRLGSEISPRFTWADIVLPAEVEEALRELAIRVRHQGVVFGEWGFDRRHAASRSLSALFSGPSGTGKTMAAEVIANELALPIYRVDLSAVVSKYIGETEKNLAQIFGDAAASGAILFFDEADALFGRRSEVRDSHDRYANMEVSYLLQRMEDYDGIVILASNLRQNMDEAFVRRLHLTVDFPFPDTASRLEIWRRTLPPQTPLAADVDLPALARRFRLSGGHIRNACVTAAFLAAAEPAVVSMRHLLAAVRREHQKMGKLLIAGGEGGEQA